MTKGISKVFMALALVATIGIASCGDDDEATTTTAGGGSASGAKDQCYDACKQAAAAAAGYDEATCKSSCDAAYK